MAVMEINLASQQEESRVAQQKAAKEKRRLDAALQRSSQAEMQLKSRVSELEQNLAGAENRESLLREMQRETKEQLKDAELRQEAVRMEIENCRKAKNDVEKSLAEEKQSSQSLRQQLQKLIDAASRCWSQVAEKALQNRTQNAVTASVAVAQQSPQAHSLQQLLQQTQRETGTQIKMLNTDLQKSKQEIISLRKQLEDYKQFQDGGMCHE